VSCAGTVRGEATDRRPRRAAAARRARDNTRPSQAGDAARPGRPLGGARLARARNSPPRRRRPTSRAGSTVPEGPAVITQTATTGSKSSGISAGTRDRRHGHERWPYAAGAASALRAGVVPSSAPPAPERRPSGGECVRTTQNATNVLRRRCRSSNARATGDA